MERITARCGYRCDPCPAFKPNVADHPEARRLLSDGWHRLYGFRIPAAEICCDGCMADDPQLIEQG